MSKQGDFPLEQPPRTLGFTDTYKDTLTAEQRLLVDQAIVFTAKHSGKLSLLGDERWMGGMREKLSGQIEVLEKRAPALIALAERENIDISEPLEQIERTRKALARISLRSSVTGNSLEDANATIMMIGGDSGTAARPIVTGAQDAYETVIMRPDEFTRASQAVSPSLKQTGTHYNEADTLGTGTTAPTTPIQPKQQPDTSRSDRKNTERS